MAEFNTVPLGQAGTGSAFRLGENRALPLFQQDVERQRLEREAKAQQLAKSWRDNALAASKGQLFASELGKIEQDHIQKGYQLRQQGIDPYNPDVNNPRAFQAAQDYMAERRDIENKRAYRDGLETRYKDYMTKLSGATQGDYDSEIVSEINKMVSTGSLNDLYTRGATLPTLQKKVNTRDILKGVQAPTISDTRTENGLIKEVKYIDENAAKNIVLSTLLNDRGGQSVLLKATGGLPIQEVASLPDTKEAIKKRLIEDYMGDPILREQLASNQIKVGSETFNKLMDEKTEINYKAKKGLDGVLNNGVNQISEGIGRVSKSKPEIGAGERIRLDIAEANLNLARQRERRLATAEAAKAKGTDAELYRVDLVNRILSGDPGSFEEVGALVNAKGTFGADKLAVRNNANGSISITVPAYTTKNSKGVGVLKRDERIITFDPKSPTSDIKMNELINELTGESYSLSKFKTGNASGKMQGQGSTTQQQTKTTTLKKIPGYN